MLTIRGLVRRFGRVAALQGVDLEIGAGDVFALLGGSGSGKTTLLRCIAGFETPDAGTITLNGTDLLKLPAHRRPLNTVFQSYALFPHLSVAGNIGFGLQDLSRAAKSQRVAEMLELVRLPGLGDRRPDQLSGGQKQRVALARALARRPPLLLLDEPLSALDRALREGTRVELLTLQRQLGTTFMLVTHDQEEALGMATRIGIMRAGRLVQVGPPAEVYERPANRFVAEFLGAANILTGTMTQAGPRASTVQVGEIAIHSSCDGPKPGSLVSLAIRPERIALGPGENTLAGTVHDIAYRGDAYVITVRTQAGADMRVATRPGEPAYDRGARITLGWSREATILLAPE